MDASVIITVLPHRSNGKALGYVRRPNFSEIYHHFIENFFLLYTLDDIDHVFSQFFRPVNSILFFNLFISSSTFFGGKSHAKAWGGGRFFWDLKAHGLRHGCLKKYTKSFPTKFSIESLSLIHENHWLRPMSLLPDRSFHPLD